jgi:hypothetical protein
MSVQRDNADEQRLERIDEILKHLRQLEKDTGKIIGSVQKERLRGRADIAINPRAKTSDRPHGPAARKKR